MNFRTIVFGISFLISIFKNKRVNPAEYLLERYGQETLKIYKKVTDTSRQLEKATLDLEFLRTCKTYDIVPKFLRFKLYRKNLQSTQLYKSWQVKLLNLEIDEKRKRINFLETSRETNFSSFFRDLSVFDRLLLNQCIKSHVNSYVSSVKLTHKHKLENLGIFNELRPVEPEKIVHNYSSITIPSRIKTLLAFGLDFQLPIYKLDFCKFFTPIEKIAHSLSNERSHDIPEFYEKLRQISYKFYYSFKPTKVFSAIFGKCEINLLREFSRKHKGSIVISTPDKGKGVVIVDRSTYVSSMENLISDPSRFSLITEPIQKYCMRIEDKINRFLSKLLKSSSISQATYNSLHVTGSGPGILYGLPKIHKPNFSMNFPYRPILAAYNLASYKISKYLVPILASLTSNQYTVLNSTEFARQISAIDNADQYYMVSLDIQSLFTNIPLQETIEIAINALFLNATQVMGLPKDLFKTLLELASMNTFFLFNEKYYLQKDGVGMGLPLGPTFANLFLCHHEKIWLSSCPPDFKPAHYFRYVNILYVLNDNLLGTLFAQTFHWVV